MRETISLNQVSNVHTNVHTVTVTCTKHEIKSNDRKEKRNSLKELEVKRNASRKRRRRSTTTGWTTEEPSRRWVRAPHKESHLIRDDNNARLGSLHLSCSLHNQQSTSWRTASVLPTVPATQCKQTRSTARGVPHLAITEPSMSSVFVLLSRHLQSWGAFKKLTRRIYKFCIEDKKSI